MNNVIDALRISPKFTSKDWEALQQDEEAHWKRAAEIVHDRLHGRFLRLASKCLSDDPYSGFVVLSIDSLFMETLQQFRKGKIKNNYKAGDYFGDFLSAPRFQSDFDDDAKLRFYEDIRCGLLHQAEARGMWLIKRCRPRMLEKLNNGEGYILDVRQFHEAVCQSLEDYCKELVDPDQKELRANLWTKMDHISNVRVARGLLVEAENP